MATHDYVLDNATGANFRSDLNNALAAIVSNNSNSSEPSTKYAYQWWVDTTANIVKIRNSANDGWINLFTTAGGIDVDAASNFAAAVTFTEDVTFTGASANIVFDKSTDDLIFNDGAKAIFGTSSDGIEIYHASNESFIDDQGSGNLFIRSNGAGIHLKKHGTTETLATFNTDGNNEFYFDNSSTFASGTFSLYGLKK